MTADVQLTFAHGRYHKLPPERTSGVSESIFTGASGAFLWDPASKKL